jgi:BirA family biotin operon repressor/biotin-[acetyl-CoA-carboxylase] ligase
MPPIGASFLVLDTVDSTNIHAMRLASGQDVGHGTVVFARRQTAGKGQRGRHWLAETGSSILMSIVLDTAGMEGGCGFPLSITAALAASDLLRDLLGDAVRIKWPNDVYWHDRKAGGILIENILRGGRCRRSVVGIGINVNQASFDPSLPNPVSIRQVTGLMHDPEGLARTLCRHLEARFATLAGDGPSGLLADYNERLYGRGLPLPFEAAGERFTGTIEGVGADGILTVRRPQAVRYRHGEVALLGPGG